jgi:adenosylcobinamide-phosphate synthase
VIFYAQIFAAMLLDLLFGDPRWLPHPVRFIGWLCERYEHLLRRAEVVVPTMLLGACSFFLVLLTSLASAGLILVILEGINQIAALAGALLLLYSCLAAGDLISHSRRVYFQLRDADLDAARQAVSMIVGRDTATLDSSEVARACVESVAENLVDGITAPLFWALVASLFAGLLNTDPLFLAALGAVCYKAVNTMDSMYGYRTERYLQFGRFAARVDDVCNFLPARLSGLCVVLAAALLRYDGAAAWRVFLQDRLKSSSPNSGHTEAAVAGALNIQLGGTSSYFGVTQPKPLIGAGRNMVEPDDIARVNRIVQASAWLFFILGAVFHFILRRVLT